MTSVWFSDCVKVIALLQTKLPSMVTFDYIRGNNYGDFVVKSGLNYYVVKHGDFSLWQNVNDEWVEVE